MDYWRTIEDYQFRYPFIRHLLKVKDEWTVSHPHATVLQFWPDRVLSIDFNGLDELRRYVIKHEKRRRGPELCNHNLYLIEDLNAEVVNILGGSFWIDPYLFACQASVDFHAPWDHLSGSHPRPILPLSRHRQRLETWECQGTKHGNGPSEPTSFTLRYPEVVEVMNRPRKATRLQDNFNREMRFDKIDLADHVSIVRRCASFWVAKQDDSWDAIVLVEPPIPTRIDCKPLYYGYCDISPWPSSPEEGYCQNHHHPWLPDSKRRIFRDLARYWTTRSTPVDRAAALRDPRCCATHLTKIAAAQWTLATDYLWYKVCQHERAFWDFEEAWYEGKKLESFWPGVSQASLWRRKMGELTEWLLVGLESLGIDHDGTWHGPDTDFYCDSNTGVEGERHQHQPQDGRLPCSYKEKRSRLDPRNPFSESTRADFLHIIAKLKAYQSQLDSNLTAITALAQLTQSDISIGEAQRSTNFARVGSAFLPLVYVASLFSMAGSFQPGEAQFWEYWVVAIPITVVLVFAWEMWNAPSQSPAPALSWRFQMPRRRRTQGV